MGGDGGSGGIMNGYGARAGAWSTAARRRSFQTLNERGFTPLACAQAHSVLPLAAMASMQWAASAASMILRRGVLTMNFSAPGIAYEDGNCLLG